jgi:hypothetical protein
MASILRFGIACCALSLASGLAESCKEVRDSSVPCVEVPDCASQRYGAVIIDQLANGNGPSVATSNIKLCHDNEFLHVTHVANDQMYFTPNENLSECNSDIYSSDVAELFIAPYMEAEPHCYNELDISPYFGGVRFDAGIYNANLNQTGISGTDFGCVGEPGYDNMTTSVAADVKNHRWTATLSFNWGLINCPFNCPMQLHYCGHDTPNTIYRANFFRIHQLLADKSRCGSGADDSCEYLAWSPTLANPPAFHVPTKFGYLVLV